MEADKLYALEGGRHTRSREPESMQHCTKQSLLETSKGQPQVKQKQTFIVLQFYAIVFGAICFSN
jgi:hypothetical protein